MASPLSIEINGIDPVTIAAVEFKPCLSLDFVLLIHAG